MCYIISPLLPGSGVCAVFTAVSQAVPVGTNRQVTLSLLDMFDRERINLLAERDSQSFAGAEPCRLTKDEIVSLTAVLETI
jgi:hypothetical protein